MIRNIAIVLLMPVVLLMATACENFTTEDKLPLEGERISILELQRDLAPDPVLSQQLVTLPPDWVNQFWPQAGGYPNHAMGHLTLGDDLEKVWSVSIGKGGNERAPLTAAPVVAEETVFTVDTKGMISAFDLKTGKRKWQKSVITKGDEETGALGGGLAYASGKLYATTGFKFLLAVNPETGHLIWRQDIPAPARAAPTVADDRVYVTTLDNRLLVFAATDGTLLWQYAGVGETTNLLGSASVAADRTLVVLPLSSGELYGLRPENGRIAWEDNLSAVRRTGPLSSIADIRGLPVIDQGIVFAVSYSGRLVAIDQISGRRIWQREIGAAETPWSAGAQVFMITAEQQLLALARETGGIYWVRQLPRYEDKNKEEPVVWAGPVLAGGRLFAAGSNGRLLEIDPQDGETLKEIKLPAGAMIPPVVAQGHLLLLGENGKLTVYR